ncbi:hypothetical protein NNX39_15385 [Arthrobacter sp. zg-Y826]|uniref:hypothetical protein n=1 Tax=Arthrobacter jinronghuae TaxID=2964609 RepID=UPI002105B52A|nr:hypothetical protein [Arthrobacter jinronghuae]MCQ1957877.1 hypothetical protein [Arthrobacter jinronghuae]
MAVFDVLVNNADCKGDHVLDMGDGHQYGVDPGLTFHSEHKLRTVLWGWSGHTLRVAKLEGIDRSCSRRTAGRGGQTWPLLTAEGVASLAAPCT